MAADVLRYNNYLLNEQTETTLIQNTSRRLFQQFVETECDLMIESNVLRA